MPPQSNAKSNVDQVSGLEREILWAMCTSPHLTGKRSMLLGALASHVWRDPEHRVVYEALLRIRARDPDALRSELPATATRMGFPDVEWSEYFQCGDTSQIAEVESRIRALATASAQLPFRP
jgi:hypothetical protein